MPDTFTLIGWILTIVFGITSLIQFLDDRARRRNIVALKATMDSMIRFSESALIENEQTPNPDKLEQTIIALRHMSLAAQDSLDTMLPRRR